MKVRLVLVQREAKLMRRQRIAVVGVKGVKFRLPSPTQRDGRAEKE